MTLDNLWGQTSVMNNSCLYNVDIHVKFYRDWLNKKYIAEKDDSEILRWPFVTINDLWVHTSFNENLCLYTVSIQRNFYYS